MPVITALRYKIKSSFCPKFTHLSYLCINETDFGMKILLLSILLIGIAILALGVKVFFVKGGKFPSGHVHDIEALKGRRRDSQNENQK